ncbi:MAG: hypothetical protein AT712_05810 [Caldivirga sp. CIS_19]|jgi:Protein of unknown function DUF131.|nr:MAG: hypothetical protein AT712_05810 [Caldivirga sp. CIS_19]
MAVNGVDLLTLSILLAFILVVVGVMLIIVDAARGKGGEEGRGNAKYGGVVVIGPVPIVFGNDSSVVKWAIILTIVVVLVFALLILLPMMGV